MAVRRWCWFNKRKNMDEAVDSDFKVIDSREL